MEIRELAVRRTARIAELGTGVADPRALWVVVHGHRQLAHRFLRRFAHVDDGSRRIVAPEALNHFYLEDRGGRHGPEHPVGATWMTRHHREAQIGDYVAYLDAVAADLVSRTGGRVPLFALGFSQGQHTVARWCVLGDAPLRGAVFWGDVMPGDLPSAAAERLAALRCVCVRGAGDTHLTDELLAADARRWAAWGVEPEVVEHPGGHDLEAEALRRVMTALEDGRAL